MENNEHGVPQFPQPPNKRYMDELNAAGDAGVFELIERDMKKAEPADMREAKKMWQELDAASYGDGGKGMEAVMAEAAEEDAASSEGGKLGIDLTRPMEEFPAMIRAYAQKAREPKLAKYADAIERDMVEGKADPKMTIGQSAEYWKAILQRGLGTKTDKEGPEIPEA
jgi:hypothetical protein